MRRRHRNTDAGDLRADKSRNNAPFSPKAEVLQNTLWSSVDEVFEKSEELLTQSREDAKTQS
jgi:hypothetical protein